MKALNLLTNTEKGRILIELFPEEKIAIISALLEKAKYIQDHAAELKDGWGNGFVTFDFWYSLAKETENTIRKYKYSLQNNNRVFSDQLFYGHIAAFTIDCILKYADSRNEHPKFQKMVSVLFG